jgi:dihydroorotate dehydrogenase (fumarate)
MDLTTTYLGFELANPIVVGACPLGSNLDTVRHLEDSGASAVVLPSLFEEELLAAVRTELEMESAGAGFAEATLGYHADPAGYHIGPEQYLHHLEALKAIVKIPVIGSLNGTTPGGWTRYAKRIQEAGADAIELNVFYLPFDPTESGVDVESRTVEVVQAVKGAVTVPVAVKLSPFFSSIPSMARRLQEAGADGLVIFNRFYQPDIDIEALEVVPNLRLSSADELRMRLRWLAVLSGQLEVSLACTGGAHSAVDVIKAVMAGADVVQLVSALLIHGPEHIARILEAVEFWLQEHEYSSLGQMRGSMGLSRAADPDKFARANYMRMLDSWQM